MSADDYQAFRSRPGPTSPPSVDAAIEETLLLFQYSYEGAHPVGQEMCEQILRNQLAILWQLSPRRKV